MSNDNKNLKEEIGMSDKEVEITMEAYKRSKESNVELGDYLDEYYDQLAPFVEGTLDGGITSRLEEVAPLSERASEIKGKFSDKEEDND